MKLSRRSRSYDESCILFFKIKLKDCNDCYESCQASRKNQIVSKERITTEFTKILSTEKPSVGLKILQVGLMKYIFPEIHVMYGMEQTKEWKHKDVFFTPWKLLIMRQSYQKK